MSRALRLQAHIDAVTGKAAEWGVDDCSRWPAAWVEAERGEPLPLPVYRGEAEGRLLIERSGGLLAIWTRIAGRCGIFSTTTPQLGDIGLIETRLGVMGTIVAKDGICALRTLASVTYLRPRKFLCAWTI